MYARARARTWSLESDTIDKKRIGSRYVTGRTRAWLKTKNPDFQRSWRATFSADDLWRMLIQERAPEIYKLLMEILRVLGENPEKEWSAATLAREVQTQPQNIGAHLAALQARGLLLSVTQGTEVCYRYGTSTSELEQMMKRLLQVYRERPVTMINLVYARAKEVLKTFAEAFRLKKES